MEFVHPEDSSLEYPLVKLVLDDPLVMLKNLSDDLEEFTRKHKISLSSRGHIFIKRFYEESYEIDSISSHFTEEVRVLCLQNNVDRLVDKWKTLSSKELKRYNVRNPKDSYNLRIKLFDMGAKECNFFSPYLGGLLLKLSTLSSLRVIDPSAGWGDRALSCVTDSRVSKYIGFDPNINLKEGYDKISQKFDKVKDLKFIIRPFDTLNKEEIEEIKKTYKPNFCMTSPPFWDLEDYSSSEGDSLQQGETFDEWCNRFYSLYIRNIIKSLMPRSLVIFYVSNYTSRKTKEHVPLQDRTIELFKQFGCQHKKTGYFITNKRKLKSGRPFVVFYTP